jgi:hypothetical protein
MKPEIEAAMTRLLNTERLYAELRRDLDLKGSLSEPEVEQAIAEFRARQADDVELLRRASQKPGAVRRRAIA